MAFAWSASGPQSNDWRYLKNVTCRMKTWCAIKRNSHDSSSRGSKMLTQMSLQVTVTHLQQSESINAYSACKSVPTICAQT